MRQLCCILPDNLKPLNTVTTLTLDVEHDMNHRCYRVTRRGSERPTLSEQRELQQDCGLVAITRVVFAKLALQVAAAMPNLKALNLTGYCWEPALDAFGANCPNLTSLTVDPQSVPIEALHNFGKHLPNLTSLVFCNEHESFEAKYDLAWFIDAALVKTRRCAKLTTLSLELDPFIHLDCKPQSWTGLPDSLEYLHCACSVYHSPEFLQLVRKVPKLSLYQYPFSSMLELVEEFPVLQDFEFGSLCSATADDCVELQCKDFQTPARIAALKACLASKPFQLECDMEIVGTCEQVQALLVWLPPFPRVHAVTLRFYEKRKVQCLEKLAHAFPAASCVKLAGRVGGQNSPSMDMEFFSPLTAFANLRNLAVSCTDLKVTTAGMLQLCTELKDLGDVRLAPGKGVDRAELAAGLYQLRRNVEVKVGKHAI